MGATGFAYSRFFEMMGLEFVDLYCDDCIVCLAQGLLGTLFHPTTKRMPLSAMIHHLKR